MSYTVIGAIAIILLGAPAFLIVKKLLADEKKKQAVLRTPLRFRLSEADRAAQEAVAAQRQSDRQSKFGRRSFEQPKSTRKMFSWS